MINDIFCSLVIAGTVIMCRSTNLAGNGRWLLSASVVHSTRFHIQRVSISATFQLLT